MSLVVLVSLYIVGIDLSITWIVPLLKLIPWLSSTTAPVGIPLSHGPLRIPASGEVPPAFSR
jgi:hypothetical protein